MSLKRNLARKKPKKDEPNKLTFKEVGLNILSIVGGILFLAGFLLLFDWIDRTVVAKETLTYVLAAIYGIGALVALLFLILTLYLVMKKDYDRIFVGGIQSLWGKFVGVAFILTILAGGMIYCLFAVKSLIF